MAAQTFTLQFTNGLWSSGIDDGLLVDSALIEGGEIAYLVFFGITSTGINILRLSATPEGSGLEAGPHLNNVAEISSGTFNFGDFILAGPNHPGNTDFPDATEPYRWTDPGFAFFAYMDQASFTGSRTFVLNDTSDITTDGEWSNVNSELETADSDWSIIVPSIEPPTVDSNWSNVISGLESLDSEWSLINSGLETYSSEWSNVTGGIGPTGVQFLDTPDMPIDLIAIDEDAGIYGVDIAWTGQASHIHLEQVRTRWIARVDKRSSPAPEKAEAEEWTESADRIIIGDFQYVDVISRTPSQITLGPVVLFDQLLNDINFADAALWVMARLEVDDLLKTSQPAPGSFTPFHVIVERDASQTVVTLVRGSEDLWCVGQMALQPTPTWEVVVTVAGIQDLYQVPFQWDIIDESITLNLTTIVGHAGFILHAVNYLSDSNILFRREWNSPPVLPASSFGPFVITNTDTTLIVDPILNCP